MLPGDATLLDGAALVLFLLLWLGYGAILDRLAGRRTINRLMGPLRRAWMRAMLRRDNRITDAALIGQAMQSVTFFASTAILVIAGLFGVLTNLGPIHALVAQIDVAQPASDALFEAKTLLLLALFVYAFFQFTWALRQLNYTLALIGSAPAAADLPADGPDLDRLAANAAGVLDMAMGSFNAGLRAYYLALAALAWFIQPWLFILATAGVFAILLRRQAFSAARRMIEAQIALLGRD